MYFYFLINNFNKRKMMRLMFFLIFSAFTIAACQNAPEEKLLADYKVRYIASSQNLTIQAKYKTVIKGKKEVSFKPALGVGVLGKTMEYKSMQGVAPDYYSYDHRTKFPDKIAFQFEDNQHQFVEQSINFKPISSIQIKEKVIRPDSGFTLVWQGDTLRKDEELVILLEIGGETVLKLSKVGQSYGKKVYIRREQLENLQPGKGTITLVQKRYQRYPTESSVSGSYILEYYHLPIETEVKKE